MQQIFLCSYSLYCKRQHFMSEATSGIKAVGEADPLGSDAYATTPPGGLTDAESQLIFGNDVDVPMPPELANMPPYEENALQNIGPLAADDHTSQQINHETLPLLESSSIQEAILDDVESDDYGRPMFENGFISKHTLPP